MGKEEARIKELESRSHRPEPGIMIRDNKEYIKLFDGQALYPEAALFSRHL